MGSSVHIQLLLRARSTKNQLICWLLAMATENRRCCGRCTRLSIFSIKKTCSWGIPGIVAKGNIGQINSTVLNQNVFFFCIQNESCIVDLTDDDTAREELCKSIQYSWKLLGWLDDSDTDWRHELFPGPKQLGAYKKIPLKIMCVRQSVFQLVRGMWSKECSNKKKWIQAQIFRGWFLLLRFLSCGLRSRAERVFRFSPQLRGSSRKNEEKKTSLLWNEMKYIIPYRSIFSAPAHQRGNEKSCQWEDLVRLEKVAGLWSWATSVGRIRQGWEPSTSLRLLDPSPSVRDNQIKIKNQTTELQPFVLEIIGTCSTP